MDRSTASLEKFFAFAEAHHAGVKVVAWSLIGFIAWLDWATGPALSIGFLYILPILMISALLGRVQIGLLALACALLLEEFHPLAWEPSALIRIPVAIGGFGLAGFFISELERSRREVMAHLREANRQTALRQDAERQMQILIDTSPLAILTLDGEGRVALANGSAHELLGYDPGALAGADAAAHLPILKRLLRQPRDGGELRTTVECTGERRNGEIFLAHLWISSFGAQVGPALAVVVWDASENLRDREGTGLDSMMQTSRVLISAFSHEIRNLAAAASRTHAALAATGVAGSEAYLALGTILSGMEQVASSGLQLAVSRLAAVADLSTILNEARIVMEPSIRDLGGTVEWTVAADLPLVRADHYSLLQVFLNLARNSEQALEDAEQKRVEVGVAMERDLVVVRFQDSGPGVADPERLFRPFQSGAHSAGLGLYVSRAILRSQGGDLRYEMSPGGGACFVMELWPAEEGPAA